MANEGKLRKEITDSIHPEHGLRNNESPANVRNHPTLKTLVTAKAQHTDSAKPGPGPLLHQPRRRSKSPKKALPRT